MAMDHIREAIPELEAKNGSGWVFQQVLSINLNVARYKPLKGSSYIELPKALVSKRAIVNVKNTDNECFRWSVLSALCDSYDTKHPERSFKKLSKLDVWCNK